MTTATLINTIKAASDNRKLLVAALKEVRQAGYEVCPLNSKTSVMYADGQRLITELANGTAALAIKKPARPAKTTKTIEDCVKEPAAVPSTPKQVAIEQQLRDANARIAELEQQLADATNEIAEYQTALDNMTSTIKTMRTMAEQAAAATPAPAPAPEYATADYEVVDTYIPAMLPDEVLPIHPYNRMQYGACVQLHKRGLAVNYPGIQEPPSMFAEEGEYVRYLMRYGVPIGQRERGIIYEETQEKTNHV